MKRTRQQAIADNIAAKILRNTRKRFSTLHAEALQEIKMSNDNMKDMNTGSPVNVGPIKQTDHKAFEGANKGEHRAEANHVIMPPQPAPRAETTEDESAGA